jgi:hypothetical protein
MRLEFEIDSEVYPELHAALSALKSTRARAERLRQLAAAGLVWEKVRLHGTGVPPEPAARVEPAPAPPARPERRARPSRHDVEQAIRELPVLMDVVADVRPLHEAADTLHEEPAHWAAMSAYPDDIADTDTGAARGDDADTLADLPDPTLHVSALAHKPATRSRLMRMKERGLFKNG